MATTIAAPEMAAIFSKLSVEGDRPAVASELATAVKAAGISSLTNSGALAQLKAGAEDKDAGAREGALLAIAAVADGVGRPAEPYLMPLLAAVLGALADKAAPVRAAAQKAQCSLEALLCPHGIGAVLPTLFEAMLAQKWQTNEGACKMLSALADRAPRQVAFCLPEIVPKVTEAMGNARPAVKDAAVEAMTKCMNVVGNRDIEQFIPILVSCLQAPANVPDTVHKLASTTFVQTVEAPTLSIMVPLLVRGLRQDNPTAIKRKACLIIENMAKLVDNPLDAVPFLPKLLPGLEKVANEVADPECRSVAQRAHKELNRVGNEGKTAPPKKRDPEVVAAALKELIAARAPAVANDEVFAVTLGYVGTLCAALQDIKNFEFDEWNNAAAAAYLSTFIPEADAEAVTRAYLARAVEEAEREAAAARVVDEDEGEELCNCDFSLAYGAKILLNNATMRLLRGHRYGLCGPNGVGKSTLMRAIANGQVDGFPPADELRTVYVEHDIQASHADLNVVEFVFVDPLLHSGGLDVTREEIEAQLTAIGFTQEMLTMVITALSGGWKMKLALARAMLMKADILLLDEPTNHLDVANVAWLEAYLTGLTQVTSIIVSHDSGFLDRVCSDIIHYVNRKLKVYKGNLTAFVAAVPEAQSYYKLEATEQEWRLPEPGFLEGVKSKDKAILKMHKVAFTYPGRDAPTFTDATLQVSLSSRVACVGPNGAGKSTLIKVLTGETEATDGGVWKHPNLRIAYVAQHAFHHIEQHLDKTPNEYIQWRYAVGEDREALQKVTRQETDEDKAAREKVHVIDGIKLKVDKLLSRRKLKKDYEYEVQWQGQGPDTATWLPRDDIVEMGFERLVNELDAKEAARMGLMLRPLTKANIEKHLGVLGLEAEFATHAHMRGLSGGQKVKVVLAACTWNQPHILVMDEPTNYLDRDSLGALAGAIREYGGGVVIISHHNEFTTALCPEKWTVGGGKVVVTGAPQINTREKVEFTVQEEVQDAFGNTIKVKGPKKKLSRKEAKAAKKARDARRARGEDVTDSEEEDE
ncbi:MAG: elongation factor EF-3 [Monoraphidium minutum]|nr:MAG: elongation factor EF-3 [Monoraphidium minutum]